MTTVKRLGLNKLFLWSEAERFQTYPQALARLMPGRTYTRQQIGADLFGLTYRGSAKPRRESVLANVFGLVQTSADKVQLRGINLFRRVTPSSPQIVSGMTVWERADDEWMPTDAAIKLGEAYHVDPDGVDWQRLLAEQLARYEPRTRVMLYLLSHGCALRFESAGYFGGRTNLAKLTGHGDYLLFSDQGNAFCPLLQDNRETAIGPWWQTELDLAGFSLAADYVFEGAMARSPSMNDINSALKAALRVFYSLGVLVDHNGDWSVEVDAFTQQLSAEVAQDLLGIASPKRLDLSDDWTRLEYAAKTLTDEQGFVIVSELAERWGELARLPIGQRLAAFDALIRRGVFEGRVEILDRHPGQPRMGHGLFDDDNMRMIKLRVLT